MSLYRSPSVANAALYKSPSMSAFGGAGAPGGGPFGSMSVADLGSLTRLEVSVPFLRISVPLQLYIIL